ncbi:ABC transporter permease [Rhodoferax sp.]|jgi:putative ABC transport system permease protein|uniref:ABC transporter permease n=1 Tax=Rhodoferax sp. TaxID=50421 RepID=UPI0025D8E689|nr:ABC transporter permease [Rhodoferax sp.]MCM2296844.1 ABC transporter permease [Rhodoferax sp.]
MWLSTLLLAMRSIRRNLLRSFLTILGIVIGVSAVITMVTVGNGATLAIQNQIAGLGTNLLQVRPGQRMMGGGGGGAPSFKAADAQALMSQVSGLLAVAPEARSGATLVLEGRNWSSSVIGSTQDWMLTGNWKLADGRLFNMEEQVAGSGVCLIGETVRRELFGSQTAVGASIRVKQISCEVIGVLDSKGQGAFGNDQDDLVFMPLNTLQRRITGNTRVNTLMVSMQESANPERIKAAITQLLRERRKLAESDEDNFNVLDTKQLGEAFSSTTKVMTTLLGAVAAVSLLVGGIGIMNIMLVSVTERTREIGLRLAIGALEREVLMQFLIEAVVLSALGGVMGILLATGASVALARVMEVPFVFNPGINGLAFVFSAGIGVLFGYFPARRAARLDPIEALRHE